MIDRSRPMAARMIPMIAMVLPLELIPRMPSTIPTTLRIPPQIKIPEPHRERMPRTREAMANPILSPGGVCTGAGTIGAGGFVGTGGTGAGAAGGVGEI